MDIMFNIDITATYYAGRTFQIKNLIFFIV